MTETDRERLDRIKRQNNYGAPFSTYPNGKPIHLKLTAMDVDFLIGLAVYTLDLHPDVADKAHA